ncbi:hypothetical protein [Fundidesulfovibrio agrisoli]|uniref:hypothetical protein n=1 Tax=Fundidesulfovibrio agrisoli TaxID=2922717 RepID=UPI001FAD20CB|nr:hypothetical protein [Fundidesulfovibrio agrisoli]
MYATHPVPDGLVLLDASETPAPSASVLERVEALWAETQARTPGLFNGSLFSLAAFDGARALGFMAQYKWYVAQLAEPSLFEALRVRSLAVSGLVNVRGHLVFGKRRAGLSLEGGLWELAPSGTLSDASREPDGSLSWRGQFARELTEELGLSAPLGALKAFALVEDTATNIWELGVSAELDLDPGDVLAAYAGLERTEHDQLSIVPLADVPRFHKTRRKELTGVTGPLLAAAGYIKS